MQGAKPNSAKTHLKMERRVLLVLGERKKIATLPPPNADVLDSAMVRNAAREQFSITAEDNKITVQTYDLEFDDWIDANDDFTVNPKDRIKIVVLSGNQASKGCSYWVTGVAITICYVTYS